MNPGGDPSRPMPLSPPAWVPRLVPRARDVHKGDLGHLLIVGGSLGLTGAVCLSAAAALRSGVGLVTCAVPRSLATIFEVKTTEAMTLALEDRGEGFLRSASWRGLKSLLERVDAVVIGPGMGRSARTQKFFAQLVEWLAAADKPHLIDADGLCHMAQLLAAGAMPKSSARVITPHAREMERITDAEGAPHQPDRRSSGAAFCERHPGVLVLKGPGTLICAGRDIIENSSGNPGMATGGTGDVLTGIIGAYLARGHAPREAALRGVWLHGRAGDFAAYGAPAVRGTAEIRPLGEESLIASDIIDSLPAAICELLNEA
ncbi:MAG: NAD(P)H-hydrate dehydratase [Planctomycetota bacterium]